MKKLLGRIAGAATLLLAFLTQVGQANAQSPYCNANTSYNPCYYNMHIDRFDVKLLGTTIYSNTSGCVNAYDMYGSSSSPVVTLIGNTPYEFDVYAGGGYQLHFGVWIDLNGDEDYDDTDEFIAGTSGAIYSWYLNATTSAQNFSWTMPNVSSTVTTRMRIRTEYYYASGFYSSYDACNWLQYGETEEYAITLQPQFTNDVAAVGATSPNSFCGAAVENVSVNILNMGTDAQSNFTVGAIVSGTLNGSAYNNTFTTTYSSSLSSMSSATVNLGTINTLGGANLTIRAFTSLAGDEEIGNDSSTTKFVGIGQPSSPSPVQTSYSRCGNGTLTLQANASSGETNLWYDAPTGGNLVAIGDNFTTPTLSTTKTYYLTRAKVGASTSPAGPGFKLYTNIGSTGVGVYFDITPTTTIALDSFYWYFYYGGTTDISVYIRTGTFQGSELNGGTGWTRIHYAPGFTVTSFGSTTNPTPTKIGIPTQILGTGTYGFCVYTSVSSGLYPWIHYNGYTTTSYDGLNYTHGNLIYNSSTPFNGNQYGLGWGGDIVVKYRKACTNNTRSAVQAIVKRMPTGSTLSKGAPFNGTYRTGSINSFDHAKAGDAVTYEIVPPTGFSNSGYNVTWTVSNLVVRSVKGVNAPLSSYTLVPPSGSANGYITFTGPASWTDSMIRFDMTLKNLDPANLCDSTVSRHIFVAPVPAAGYTKNDVCLGERVSFNNTSSISTGTITYLWEFGDGSTSTFTHPEYKYSTFGSYQVKLTVTSNLGYSTVSTQTVNVFEIPAISFKSTNACEGENVTFSNATTIGSGTISYNWDFGDGNSSTSANTTVSHQYAAPGEYFVKLTATANGCNSEATRRAYQFSRPVPDFTSVTECNSKASEFTSTSTIASGYIGYIWEFGDGDRSTQANPLHTYQTYGSKTIKLKTISEFGCADSITKNVMLNESPKADFTTSPVCTNDATVFTNTSQEPVTGVTIYKWYFGTGDSSSLVSPSYLYPAKGDYRATLVASNSNGCWDQKEVDVRVLVQPTADFEASNVCAGDPMKFNNKSSVEIGTAMNYTWKFDDGNTSNSISPSHIYNTAVTTVYNVTLYSNAVGGCADSVTKQVKVNAIPNCNFTITNTGNKTYVFTPATTSGVTYHWLFGNGGSSDGTNPSYKYLAWGEYTVTLVLTSIDGGCQCSRQVSFSANTGVSDVSSDNGITVYPNPNTGQFSLKLDGMNNVKAIGIYNVLGEQVGTVDVNNGSNGVYSVNLDNVSNGVYFVKVMAGDQLITKKFTVSR